MSSRTSPSVLKLIGAMTPQELKSAIEEPAKAAGLYIEEGLTERILSSLSGSPGNLPLLQFALTLLWTYREGNQLTMTSYERIGGVEKAIAHYAESLYKSLVLAEQHLTRQIFIQLVQPGEGTEDTRRIATRQELGEESWNFIESTLVFSRLVIIEKRWPSDPCP